MPTPGAGRLGKFCRRDASRNPNGGAYVKPLVGVARLLFGGGSRPPTTAADGPSPT